MAPETFDDGVKGQLVSTASDVYMLGSCFVELATGCERTPFDWLTMQRIMVFRGHDSTRHISCIQVLQYWVFLFLCCILQGVGEDSVWMSPRAYVCAFASLLLIDRPQRKRNPSRSLTSGESLGWVPRCHTSSPSLRAV